jgi:hypothetical protein
VVRERARTPRRRTKARKGTSRSELAKGRRTCSVASDATKVGSFVVPASRRQACRSPVLVTVAHDAEWLLHGARARITEREHGGLTGGLAETGSSLGCTSSLAEAATVAAVTVGTGVDRVDDGRTVGSVIGSDDGWVR